MVNKYCALTHVIIWSVTTKHLPFTYLCCAHPTVRHIHMRLEHCLCMHLITTEFRGDRVCTVLQSKGVKLLNFLNYIVKPFYRSTYTYKQYKSS